MLWIDAFWGSADQSALKHGPPLKNQRKNKRPVSCARKYPAHLGRKKPSKKSVGQPGFGRRLDAARCGDRRSHRERICWPCIPRFSLVTQIGQLRPSFEGIGSCDSLGGVFAQDIQLYAMKLKLHMLSNICADLWTRIERGIRVKFYTLPTDRRSDPKGTPSDHRP